MSAGMLAYRIAVFDALHHLCNTAARVLAHGWWLPCLLVLQAALVGMVLDLSNSDKYYDYREIEGREVRYVKVSDYVRGSTGTGRGWSAAGTAGLLLGGQRSAVAG